MDSIDKVYLHGFSDASELAYAACIYLKFITKSGQCGVKFVTAKSRIVPAKKKYSIPRLELLGNLILARLMSSVVGALKEEIAITNTLCWSDSMITLCWIKSDKKELRPFEDHRVTEIRKNTDRDKWFHCRTDQNPADVITRFHSYDDEKSRLYFDGPLFLKDLDERDHYEQHKNAIVDIDTPYENNEEINGNDILVSMVNSFSVSVANMDEIIDIKNHSNLSKLYRITAYIIRYVRNLKAVIKRESLNNCC